MNKPLLIAAVCAGWPACAAQASAPDAPPATPPVARCAAPDNAPPAASALPARASTKPEPQLGTVAPNTRVPSHVVTPSMRAMQHASAARAGNIAHVDKKAQENCAAGAPPGASEQGAAKPAGS